MEIIQSTAPESKPAARRARPPMTPAQKAMVSRLGIYTRLASEDHQAMTRAACEANWQRYLDQVDPERKLPEPERVERAKAARKADMTRRALKSSQTRARKAARR